MNEVRNIKIVSPYGKKGGTRGTGGTNGAAPLFACSPKFRVRDNTGNNVSPLFPEMFPVMIPQMRFTSECSPCSPKKSIREVTFYE